MSANSTPRNFIELDLFFDKQYNCHYSTTTSANSSQGFLLDDVVKVKTVTQVEPLCHALHEDFAFTSVKASMDAKPQSLRRKKETDRKRDQRL